MFCTAVADQALISRPENADRVRQIAVAPEVLALSTLSRVDYADAFVVDVGAVSERTAEQWARAVLEAAPEPVRRNLTSGWDAIGLNLGRSGVAGFVLGWEIRRSTPDHVLLSAASRIGMPAELLFKRESQTLLFSNFVRHENQRARRVWARVEPVHVPIVRRVLARVAQDPAPSNQQPGHEVRKETLVNADV
jgi:hypothetical protein